MSNLLYKWWWIDRWLACSDFVSRKIAYMLPAKICYWATIRVGANASTGKYEKQLVPDLTVVDALSRWPRPLGSEE